MNIKIKKLNPNAHFPTKGSDKAAGYDLYACIEEAIEIQPQKMAKIGTGIAITPPEGYFGAIFARSGLSTKRGLRPANCVGACDEDYTGEYIVVLYNDSNITQIVEPGERIAQLIFLPYVSVNMIKVDELEETERGDGGFGSTGK